MEHQGGSGAERWQRRDLRRRKARERMQKHGATLRRVYADAVRKRSAAARTKDGASTEPGQDEAKRSGGSIAER